MASIEKRMNKNGEITSYRIRVSAGYDVNGKQIVKLMSWSPSPNMTKTQVKRELARVAAEFENKCLMGQCVDDTITFANLSEMWFEDYANHNLKKTTLTSYHKLLKTIIPAIGHISIGKLQPHHLNEFYSSLLNSEVRSNAAVSPLIDFRKYIKVNDGVKRDTVIMRQKDLAEETGISLTTIKALLRGDNISVDCATRICKALGIKYDEAFEVVERNKIKGTTVKRYHAVISSICSFAVYQNIIMVNPCTRVRTPKSGPHEAEYLEEGEAEKLLAALKDAPQPFRTAIQLLLFTGMRRGELCGLQWEDIDYEHNLINVRRNVLYTEETGIYEDTPKTKSSVRGIKVSDYVINLLKEYAEWQDNQCELLGDKWEDSCKIFTNDFGAQIHPSSLSKWFSTFNKRNGLKQVPLHSLRHTSATLLIMSGVPVNVVSKRLGHNNSATTTTIYTHVLRSADEQAALALDNVILSKVKHA